MSARTIPPFESCPVPAVSTLANHTPVASICRANGWGPGTHLVGDVGRGPCVIRITAVGEISILAVEVDNPGAWEASWSLACREWRAVPQ